MSDFAPGDLVVCVDAGDFGSPGNPNAGLLREGRIYRITRVVPVSGWRSALPSFGVVVCGVRSVNDPHGDFHPDRFRKLNDGTDDAELIARIKSCKPVRESQPA